MTDERETRLPRRCRPALLGALILLAASCSEPEQTTFPLTISSLDGTEICAVGTDTDTDTDTEERCFPADDLSFPDDVVVHLDDCVTVEVDGDGRADVTQAVWRGRCSAVPIELGVTRRDTGVTVLVPQCLASFTSLRVEDADGNVRWSVARESSTEHPLITYVTLGEVPPGFVEHDAWSDPGSGAPLTVTARQQNDLPPATVTLVPDEIDESVRVGDAALASADDLDEVAGCRSSR